MKRVCIVLICLSVVLCAVFGVLFYKNLLTPAPADSTPDSPTFESRSLSLSLREGGAAVVKLEKGEEPILKQWSSSDKKVVSVDSGGRVDALKKGRATVTADFADGHCVTCKVTVSPPAKEGYPGKFTTAITANFETLKKNLDAYSKSKEKRKKLPYRLLVNRAQNCVTAYTYDEKGHYTVPVRAMACSCGIGGATITGVFNIYFHTEWHPLEGGVFGQYTSAISDDYLFHSVPYSDLSKDTLKIDEYNKLGTAASRGCIRMAVGDCKWIHRYCGVGTIVVIYDNDDPEPLGKPPTIKITDKNCKWDPTDYDKKNPYNSKIPQIKGAADKKIKVGSSYSMTAGVTATDTCGNDVTDKLIITGNVVPDRAGVYKVTYQITDALHRSAKCDVTVTVEK